MKPCFVLCLFLGCEKRHRYRRPWRCCHHSTRIHNLPWAAAPAPPPSFPMLLLLLILINSTLLLLLTTTLLLPAVTPTNLPPPSPLPNPASAPRRPHPAPKRLASRISIARPPHPRLVRTRLPTRTLVRSIVAVPVHLFGGKLDKGHMDRRPRPLLIYLTSRPSSPGVGVSLSSPLQLILISSSSSSARTLQTPDEKENHNTALNHCSFLYT